MGRGALGRGVLPQPDVDLTILHPHLVAAGRTDRRHREGGTGSDVEGRFHAIDDVCTHDGGPLADGELSGHTIACPRHGAKFDVRTGAIVIRSNTCWKNPATTSLAASSAERPRAWA